MNSFLLFSVKNATDKPELEQVIPEILEKMIKTNPRRYKVIIQQRKIRIEFVFQHNEAIQEYTQKLDNIYKMQHDRAVSQSQLLRSYSNSIQMNQLFISKQDLASLFMEAFKIITLGLTDPLEYWWITVQITKAYYVIQFYENDNYTMARCKSQYDCDMNGLNCVNNQACADIWTEQKYSDYPRKGVKLGDIVKWIKQKNFSAQYKLITHNCQDLCKAVWSRF